MMKKILYFILLLFIAACNNADHETKSVPITHTADSTPTPSSVLINQYASYLATLDTTAIISSSAAVKKFDSLFKDQPASAADSAFVLFHSLYEKLENNLNVKHANDATDYTPLVYKEPKKVISKKLLQYEDSLRRHGFGIALAEGMTYIKQDREFMAAHFYNTVSPVMKEYLEQLNKENKEGFAIDAGISITPQHFVNRIVWWETFLKQNPGFIYQTEAADHNKYLLTFLLQGMDNTPVLSFADGKIDTYYLLAYSYLQNNYAETEVSKLATPYIKALQQNDKDKARLILEDYRRKGLIMDFSR